MAHSSNEKVLSLPKKTFKTFINPLELKYFSSKPAQYVNILFAKIDVVKVKAQF